MANQILTAFRMIPMTIAAAGAIVAGHYNKKSEEAREKQLISERMTLVGPAVKIQDQLFDIALQFNKIKKEEDTFIEQARSDLEKIEEEVKRIKSFSEEKLPSQDKDIQDLFKAAAEGRKRKIKEQQTPALGGPEKKENLGTRSILPWIRSKITKNEHTTEMDR